MVHITIRTYTRNDNRDTALSTSEINGIIYNVKQVCFVVCLFVFVCFLFVFCCCCFFVFFVGVIDQKDAWKIRCA